MWGGKLAAAATTGYSIPTSERFGSLFEFQRCGQTFHLVFDTTTKTEVVQISADTFAKREHSFRDSSAYQMQSHVTKFEHRFCQSTTNKEDMEFTLDNECVFALQVRMWFDLLE